MRAALVLAGMVFAGTMPALAQPPAIVLPEPLTIGRSTVHPATSDPNNFQEISPLFSARTLSLRAQLAASSERPLTIGPISMDIGNADLIGKDGKRAHFAHVHLDDVHPLGANISGTFDGRAATIHFSWPTGQ